jgi:hypothetical protein
LNQFVFEKRHLRHVLREFIEHYLTERHHQGIGVLADVPGARMLRDAFALEEHGDAVVVGAHDHLLGDQAPRNGVQVSIEGDAAHFVDAGAEHVVGI